MKNYLKHISNDAWFHRLEMIEKAFQQSNTIKAWIYLINNTLFVLQNVKRYLSFNDITGETIEAAIVFEYSIRYLLKCLHHQINRNYVGINSEDIAFVVTVPAIWGDKAKMFMREAAIKVLFKNKFQYKCT